MLLLLTQTQAFGFLAELNKFEQKSKAKIEKNKTNKVGIKEIKECANFAGNWKGSCENKSTGEVYESQYFIEQEECQYISLGADLNNTRRYDLTFGINHESTNTKQFALSLASAVKWNSTNQVLQLEANALVSSPYLFNSNNIKVTGQFMIQNGDLIEFTHVSGDDEGERDIVCKYKK